MLSWRGKSCIANKRHNQRLQRLVRKTACGLSDGSNTSKDPKQQRLLLSTRLVTLIHVVSFYIWKYKWVTYSSKSCIFVPQCRRSIKTAVSYEWYSLLLVFLSCRHCQVDGSEPDFLHQDFSVCHRFRQKKWGWGTMLISASHWLENIRAVSRMTCDRNPNELLLSYSVSTPLPFYLWFLSPSICTHLSLYLSVTLQSVCECFYSPHLLFFPFCYFPSFLSVFFLTPSFFSVRKYACPLWID